MNHAAPPVTPRAGSLACAYRWPDDPDDPTAGRPCGAPNRGHVPASTIVANRAIVTVPAHYCCQCCAEHCLMAEHLALQEIARQH
jgi:hypothetical protein